MGICIICGEDAITDIHGRCYDCVKNHVRVNRWGEPVSEVDGKPFNEPKAKMGHW